MHRDKVLRYIQVSLRFQRRNKFIIRATGSNMLASDLHLLGEIYSNPGQNVNFYSHALLSSPSTIYRAIHRYQQSRLLRIEDYSGANHSKIYLNAKGKLLHESTSTDLANSVARLTKDLLSGQIDQATEFLKEMNERLTAPPTGNFYVDSPLRQELRRQTRVFGILGTSYMGTSLTNAQVQVLSLIAENAATCQAEIVNVLGTPPITVAQILKSLKAKKLVKSLRIAEDQRILRLVLSSTGLSFWAKVQDTMRNFLVPGFRGMSDAELEKGSHLIAIMAGITDLEWYGSERMIGKYILEVVPLSSESIVELLHNRGPNNSLPDLSKTDTYIAYFISGTLAMVQTQGGVIIWGALPKQ